MQAWKFKFWRETTWIHIFLLILRIFMPLVDNYIIQWSFFFDQKIGRLTRLFRMKTNLSSSFVVQRWQILFKFCLKIRRGLKKHCWGKIKMSARVVFRVFCHHPCFFLLKNVHFKICFFRENDFTNFFSWNWFHAKSKNFKNPKSLIDTWNINEKWNMKLPKYEKSFSGARL